MDGMFAQKRGEEKVENMAERVEKVKRAGRGDERVVEKEVGKVDVNKYRVKL